MKTSHTYYKSNLPPSSFNQRLKTPIKDRPKMQTLVFLHTLSLCETMTGTVYSRVRDLPDTAYLALFASAFIDVAGLDHPGGIFHHMHGLNNQSCFHAHAPLA